MRVTTMITNGGVHPPEKWAVVTANEIIQVATDATSQQAMDGRKLELRIIEILEKHHAKVQTHERGKIKEHKHQRLVQVLDPTEHVPAALEEIIQASAGTSFEAYFAGKKDYLTLLLSQHFATNMHIERSQYADKIPDHPNSKAFKEKPARTNF